MENGSTTTASLRNRAIIITALAVSVGFSFASLSLAQDKSDQENSEPSKASASNGKQTPNRILNAAYKITKTAKQESDYSEIIQLCRQAQAISQSKKSDAYAKKLLSWAHNRRGLIYSKQATLLSGNQAQDAEQAAKLEALALEDFDASVANDPAYYSALHHRGISYALKGEYETALKDFSSVIAEKPNFAKAWFNRGEIYYQLKRYEKAALDYTRVIQLDDADFGAFLSRGHAYFKLGQFVKSLDDYENSVQLQPKNPHALLNRSDAQRRLGRWEESLAGYRQAIEIDSTLGKAYQAAAWLLATCPDEKFRKQEEAIQLAEKALELSGPEDLNSLDSLAAAYANAGRFEEAQSSLDKALLLASKEHAETLRSRKDLYSQEKPFRQTELTAARPDSEVESR